MENDNLLIMMNHTSGSPNNAAPYDSYDSDKEIFYEIDESSPNISFNCALVGNDVVDLREAELKAEEDVLYAELIKAEEVDKNKKEQRDAEYEEVYSEVILLRQCVLAQENKIAELTRDNENLKKNICSLYKTAKAEIDQKDFLLSEANQKLDRTFLYRNSNAVPSGKSNNLFAFTTQSVSGSTNPVQKSHGSFTENTPALEKKKDLSEDSKKENSKCNGDTFQDKNRKRKEIEDHEKSPRLSFKKSRHYSHKDRYNHQSSSSRTSSKTYRHNRYSYLPGKRKFDSPHKGYRSSYKRDDSSNRNFPENGCTKEKRGKKKEKLPVYNGTNSVEEIEIDDSPKDATMSIRKDFAKNQNNSKSDATETVNDSNKLQLNNVSQNVVSEGSSKTELISGVEINEMVRLSQLDSNCKPSINQNNTTKKTEELDDANDVFYNLITIPNSVKQSFIEYEQNQTSVLKNLKTSIARYYSESRDASKKPVDLLNETNTLLDCVNNIAKSDKSQIVKKNLFETQSSSKVQCDISKKENKPKKLRKSDKRSSISKPFTTEQTIDSEYKEIEIIKAVENS